MRYGLTVVRPDLSAVKVNAEFKVARERVIDTLDDSLKPLARRLVDTDLGSQQPVDPHLLSHEINSFSRIPLGPGVAV